MNIRNKLLLLFISIVALILIATSVAVYFFSADYRKDEFYTRLTNKAKAVARLAIEVEGVTHEMLMKIEADNPMNLTKEEVSVYDSRNKILYTSDEHNFVEIDNNLLEQVREKQEVRFTRGEYECLGYLFTDQFGHFVIVVAAVDIYGFTKLGNLRTILFVVFGTAIVLILISGYFYVGRMLEPISKVIREVDDISATSLHRRVNAGNGKDEMSQLSSTFNKMLERLETAFTTQKNFIANASHEIRNPMTAILGQIDVSLLNERSAAEYVKVLQSLREDITNLKNVSNRLLLLAQASVEDAEKRFTVLRLDQLLWDSRTELNKLHPDYSISIEMDTSIDDESKLHVNGDEQLLKAAIINVLDNGCKYSVNNKVSVLLKSHAGKTVLEFKDHGIGIPEEDLPHLFEPFYRGHNTENYKGNGIGLSLVYRIIKSHFGDIRINSQVNQGTVLTIFLPVTTH
ncbi:MAG TPA: ATP-binding protein [Cyclobacteriaceae bacterium]|nr:ATP-binding protein [Cyclobacteriaceae bacterium]